MTDGALTLDIQLPCIYCGANTRACCGRCPAPPPRICGACQAIGRGCFWCQVREDQIGQTSDPTIIALERRLVPATGYISHQQRASWNVHTRHCLPQVSIFGVAFGATAPLRAEPLLQPTLQPGSSLTSLDPIASSMNAWLRLGNERNTVPSELTRWRNMLSRLDFIEQIDERHGWFAWNDLQYTLRPAHRTHNTVELERLSARAPHARISMAARATRIEDERIRAAYTLDRLAALPMDTLTCTWCGFPTANYCHTCNGAAASAAGLCRLCEEDFLECRTCRGESMARDIRPAGLGA